MDTKTQRPKGRDNVLSTLGVAIEALTLAKEVSSITPAKVAFGTVSTLLTMIRVRLLNRVDRSLADVYIGFDAQPVGLCRARVGLCQRLRRP